MKTYGAVEVELHAFLTLVLSGDEWLTSRSGRSTPGDRTPGLDAVARRKESLPLPGIEPQSPSPRPSHYAKGATLYPEV